MNPLIRRIDLRAGKADPREVLRQEWLVTNGLGGYASGTISGEVTWRYHGLLIAALPAPLGRVVMLNHLAESLLLPDGQEVFMCGHEASRCEHLTEFRLENQMPVWHYESGDLAWEKSVVLLQGQNTVQVSYCLLRGPAGVRLELRPSMQFRRHEQAVSGGLADGYSFRVLGDRFEISGGNELPSLRLVVLGEGRRFLHEGGTRREIFYQRDADRGYESRGILWSPGVFQVQLPPGGGATLTASTEDWSTALALDPQEARGFYQQRRSRLLCIADRRAQMSPAADLVLAADQFIFAPMGRVQDAARAHAAGDEIRAVIAGYHWFTDWGRDTLISLEGLTLVTGRQAEAEWILRSMASHVRHGLVPNLFPEGRNEGLYHTADATLWFFHAVERYVAYTNDRDLLRDFLPVMQDIVEQHLKGTKFGIGVDRDDGLMRQGAEGYQLTWMDAKVDDWVVTPRRGKAVEINALWYNALRLMEEWLREENQGEAADRLACQAELARESFNRRFWNADKGCLYDVIDGENGEEDACRPNQLLAFSLKHAVLEEERWAPVLEVVQRELLTPMGLRSLSRGHPEYKAKYFGDLRARDAAYHQGTVWAWLMGPFIDAWLKVHPDDKAGARRFLDGVAGHLDEGCVGSINEIFDAEEPYTPRGCIAQAWSVAEFLRCWVKTAE